MSRLKRMLEQPLLGAGPGTGRYAAYAALALSAVGLPLIGASESECQFVGSATQDYSGDISEPGKTGGILAFAVAPLIAVAALLLLARARRHGLPASRLAFAAALLVFPLAGLNFVFWVVTAALGCGIGLA